MAHTPPKEPPTAAEITAHIRSLGTAEYATALQRYFKTGPGEYGEGDVFLGVRMPALRGAVRQLRAASIDTLRQLLSAPEHEVRMFALLLMVDWYGAKRRADAGTREALYTLYLEALRADHINNWDLVDISAHRIVGPHLRASGDTTPLDDLASSPHLWSRRVAMIATLDMIRHNEFDDTMRLAELLVDDEHDLMHKAVGWMLREVGKRDRAVEEAFLYRHARTMPRTMLRYAIEKFPEELRQAYLRGTFT